MTYTLPAQHPYQDNSPAHPLLSAAVNPLMASVDDLDGTGGRVATLEAHSLRIVGTGTTPISNSATARPSTARPVYWLCANGVTPANAAPGDLVWNADA